jgi:competence protein ComGF
VDLGEMGNEKESLSSFLRSKLNIDVTSKGNKVIVYSENLSSKELKKMVNKFVHRRNLMKEYWVALEKDVVKINKFERLEKRERRKKRGTPPSIIKHGW